MKRQNPILGMIDRASARLEKQNARTDALIRLEEIRVELNNECISYSELTELQDLVEYIDSSDIQLLEAAGVKEF